MLNIREYALNDYIKIVLNVALAGYDTHMSGEKPLQIKFRKRNDAFLQKSAVATGKVGSSDTLIENYIAAK